MAYFDNAATTFPKPDCVYEFMNKFYRASGGSFGRGDYALSVSAKGLIDDTRERIKRLLHCPSKQVVFEPSATIALNIIIQGIIASGEKNIYISPFEHNAVTRTLHHFEVQGKIRVYQLSVNRNLSFDLDRIRYQFDENKPDLVILSHASNVIGLLSPAEEVFKLAKKFNSHTLLDMAQSAGLVDCDIGQDMFDFAVFAGHKTLLGPTGISGFVMKPDIELPPVIFGGTGFDSANQDMPSSIPERYEMGTMNISGIAGMNAALQWIEGKTVEKLYMDENAKRLQLLKLFDRYESITVIGNSPVQKYVGIVSCTLAGISSDTAGQLFSERNVSVRTGLHCAPLAHKFLGTFPSGTIRFSVNHFTNDDDFSVLKTALDDIQDKM